MRPSLSSHTTQRQKLSLQGPLTQCHLPVTTFPVDSTKNPAIATGHPFPPQEGFGGSVLLHTPLSLGGGHSEVNSLAHLCPLGRDVRLTADLGAVCQDHSCLPRLFFSSILLPQGKSKWHALSSAHPPASPQFSDNPSLPSTFRGCRRRGS